ncbi:MAG: hypothetical protein ACTSSH_07185 [Candidatus Heimdallarchaeota archaeon]
MSEVSKQSSPRKKIVIVFSLINFVLLVGIILFIIAVIYGGGGILSFSTGLNLGVISLLIMFIAVLADIIYLIVALVKYRKRN